MTETDPDIKELEVQLNERFAQLPKVVQNAITSADIGKRLREMAETYKLHLDQWQTLENEVMLTLLGFQRAENLEENLKKEASIPTETASALVSNIAEMIFQPIRKELERGLESPSMREERMSGTEPPADSSRPVAEKPVASIRNTEYGIQDTNVTPMQTSAQTMIENIPPRPIEVKPANQLAVSPPLNAARSAASGEHSVPQNVLASTPPPPPSIEKSVRAPISSAYTSQAPSHERKAVDGDPYREAIS